jgi:hypothetical protein
VEKAGVELEKKSRGFIDEQLAYLLSGIYLDFPQALAMPDSFFRQSTILRWINIRHCVQGSFKFLPRSLFRSRLKTKKHLWKIALLFVISTVIACRGLQFWKLVENSAKTSRSYFRGTPMNPPNYMPVFSDWCLWDDRRWLGEDLFYPGIYLLARFEEPDDESDDLDNLPIGYYAPKGPAEPTDLDIVYIGVSYRDSVRRRLDRFDYVAFRGGRPEAHTGADEYRSQFAGKVDGLFVAVSSWRGRNSALSEYFKAHERLLICLYRERWGFKPSCNRL